MQRVLLLCFGLSLFSWADSPAALAHLGKGNGLMQAERYEEAAVQFEQALASDGRSGEARKNLSICYFELRNYGKARKLFETLLSSEDRPVAIYYLARLDLIDGELDSAVAQFRSLNDTYAARERIIADWRYYLGVTYFKKEQFENAITSLKLQVKTNPRDFRARQWLARSFMRTGHTAEASNEFARARELHQYYSQGSIALGGCRTLIAAGQSDDAWAACKPLLETDDVDKVAAVGMLFGESGDELHASAAWQKAVELDPGSPELNYNFALASFQLKRIQTARHFAQIACELWPQFPEANILYGTILYMVADDAEAKRVLGHAQELTPGDANVRRLLADLQNHGQPH